MRQFHLPLFILTTCLCFGCKPSSGQKPQAQGAKKTSAKHTPHAIKKGTPKTKDQSQEKQHNTGTSKQGITTSKKGLILPPMKTRYTTPARVVAIGDIHGDLSALKRTLRLARLTDKQDNWLGGNATLVQTGDVLDRGDDEQEIIDYLDKLALQAKSQGGAIIELLGNHETMNVQGDLRYVTKGGFKDFEDVPNLDLKDARLEKFPVFARHRMAAFKPGGPYARRLSAHKVVVIVNDSMFVHGGVLPDHVNYGLDKMNQEVRTWMHNQNRTPKIILGANSPLWVRAFSQKDTTDEQCKVLEQTLKLAKVKRLVVGHTPQPQGPTQACGGKVWRIDVGMAKHYGGQPAAIEIVKGKVNILSEKAKP